MLIVLSVGGSILAKDLDPKHFSAYASALKELANKHQIVVSSSVRPREILVRRAIYRYYFQKQVRLVPNWTRHIGTNTKKA